MTDYSYEKPLKNEDEEELDENTLNKCMDNDVWIQEIDDENND